MSLESRWLCVEAQKQLNLAHRQKEAYLQAEVEKSRLAQREALQVQDVTLFIRFSMFCKGLKETKAKEELLALRSELQGSLGRSI